LKTLYICGDSFATKDKDFDIIPWFEILEVELGADWTVVNQSMVCASNLHIRLQIQSAIDNRADFIIVLATSSIRGEGRVHRASEKDKNILDRFINIGETAQRDREFGCYSYNSLDETCVFDSQRMEIMENFRNQIFDLELSIYNNQFIIESGLHSIKNSGIPFVFDQGGFENPKFSGSKKQYFNEFDYCKSNINLWSLVDYPIEHRPYFHITDQSIHHHVARYYLSKIKNYG
jgi:hypothetical protein